MLKNSCVNFETRMPHYCRTCGKFIYCVNIFNLFEEPDRIMLHQIEALTGLCLLYHSDISTNICGPCKAALREAIGFRERIIKTQKLLQSCATAEAVSKQIDAEEIMVLDIITESEDDFYADEQEDNSIDKDFETYVLSDDNDNKLDFQCADVANQIDMAKEHRQQETIDKKIGCVANSDSHSIQVTSSPAKRKLRKRKSASGVYASVSFVDNGKQGPRTNWSTLTEEQTVLLKRERRKRDCICEQCGRHFTCPSNLKVHLLRHTGVKNFTCKICSVKFYTSHLLRRHEMSHKSDKPYPCHYCGQRFSHYAGRIQHERNRHTNYKPFKCTECDKSFAASNRLKLHMLCHSGVRSFHCEICNQSFVRNSHLLAHFRSKAHKLNLEKPVVKAASVDEEPPEDDCGPNQ